VRVIADIVGRDDHKLPRLVDGDAAPVEYAVMTGINQAALPFGRLRREYALVSVLAELDPAPQLIDRAHTPHIRLGQRCWLKRQLTEKLRRGAPPAGRARRMNPTSRAPERAPRLCGGRGRRCRRAWSQPVGPDAFQHRC